MGFGTFTATNKSATKGVNPKTGVKITVPTKRAIKFKAGELLKKAVN
jgi:DNA-binding protein HU-beta